MINWSTLSEAEKTEALSRPAMADSESLRNTVAGILADVTARGDDAVLEYTRKFDCPSLEALRLSIDARDAVLYVNSALPASKPLACIFLVAVRLYRQPS